MEPTKRSTTTEHVVAPLGGFQPSGNEFTRELGSLASAQNVWVRDEVLEPRWRLSSQSINHLNSALTSFGNTTNPSSSGTRCIGIVPISDLPVVDDNVFVSGRSTSIGPMWLSGTTGNLCLGILTAQSPSRLTWVNMSATTYDSDFYPHSNETFDNNSLLSTLFTGASVYTNANWRSAMVYSASLDLTLAVLAAGTASYISQTPRAVAGTEANPSEYLMVTTGRRVVISGAASSFYGRLRNAPRAVDVTNFADRAVAWNCDGIGTRVAWAVEGDPTDWTGIGAGSQDLADMTGYGTRIFSVGEQMILASNREIWRGRFIGDPYYMQFSPIIRTVGMPYERATLETPRGIFWLGENFTLYNMQGESITELTLETPTLQNFLRQNLVAPDVAFFTYNQLLNQLRLHYSTTTSSYPTQTLVYDVDDKTWFTETSSHAVTAGISSPLLTARYSNTSADASGQWVSARPLGVYGAVVTSGGTFGVLTESATSELGSSVEEDATFVVAFANPTRKATIVEARYDFSARSASSVTASWSTNFGASTATAQVLSVASASYASQIITYPKVTAQNLTQRLQSTNGGWQLQRLYNRFDDAGEAV